jgi:hypothetical protein
MDYSTRTRPVTSLPLGSILSRYVIAKAHGHAGGLEMAEHWTDTPQILDALTKEMQWVEKAGTDPMTVNDVGAAAPIAQAGVSRELFELLRGVDAFEQMKPRMRRINFNTRTPRETGAGMGGGWVGETAPIPIVNDVFATVSQFVYKLGTATVLSKEPSVEYRASQRHA